MVVDACKGYLAEQSRYDSLLQLVALGEDRTDMGTLWLTAWSAVVVGKIDV